MIIADTSGLLAFFNAREPAHEAVRSIIDATSETLVVSPYVVAELDYLVATRMGLAQETAVLDELAGGAYDLVGIDRAELAACTALIREYHDQEIGVADASLVVLARRFETHRVLTLDRRHFDVIRPLDGGRFELLGA